MNQNIFSITFSDIQLSAIDEALAALELHFQNLISLEAKRRRQIRRMGNKSEAFCRNTFTVLDHNPRIVPSSLEYEKAKAHLASLDALRPRLHGNPPAH